MCATQGSACDVGSGGSLCLVLKFFEMLIRIMSIHAQRGAIPKSTQVTVWGHFLDFLRPQSTGTCFLGEPLLLL